jgi:hypothetical protein
MLAETLSYSFLLLDQTRDVRMVTDKMIFRVGLT